MIRLGAGGWIFPLSDIPTSTSHPLRLRPHGGSMSVPMAIYTADLTPGDRLAWGEVSEELPSRSCARPR